MKDAMCLECGAESNSLLEIMHADWCPVPNRQPPLQGPLPDSMKALQVRLEQTINTLEVILQGPSGLIQRVTALESTLDSMVDDRLQHYATSMADRLKAIEDRAVKLSDYAKGRLDLDSTALDSHEQRLGEIERIMKLVCTRQDAIEKVWKSLDQRLARLEWKSTLHEGKSVVVGHMDMATGKVEPTEAGNALMADSAGKVRLTPNQYLYGVLWRRGDADHAEMRKEVLEAIGGKGSKAQHDAIEWACSVMEPPDDFDVWTLDGAANVGPPPPPILRETFQRGDKTFVRETVLDDREPVIPLKRDMVETEEKVFTVGPYRWQENGRIHTSECAMSKNMGGSPCDCWHSKVEQSIREERADQLKRDMENAIKANRNIGDIPPEKPGDIHVRETLADVLEKIGERNADKALDNKLTEERLTEHLKGVIGQRMAMLDRNGNSPVSNHIEDTLVSPIASGEAKIMSAADKYWGGEAPKKAKRKRKWWRLGL